MVLTWLNWIDQYKILLWSHLANLKKKNTRNTQHQIDNMQIATIGLFFYLLYECWGMSLVPFEKIKKNNNNEILCWFIHAYSRVKRLNSFWLVEITLIELFTPFSRLLHRNHSFSLPILGLLFAIRPLPPGSPSALRLGSGRRKNSNQRRICYGTNKFHSK